MYNKYINNKLKFQKYQIIGSLCLISVISGFLGWVYEFIFYYFNFGCTKFYWQGGNFLPWINIYAIGTLMILFLTNKFKKNPLIVFLIAFISTGILEYLSGLLIYSLFDGLRFWNYNNEILNFGNISGFVCLRSVLFFGVSSLLLVYVIYPLCLYLSKHLPKRVFLTISVFLLSIVLIDEFYNLLFARIFNFPRARDIYSKIGINYMKYR